MADMSNKDCGVAEEKWIDWHSGSLSAEEMALLRRHRETCPSCQACSRQWEELLGGIPELKADTGRENAQRALEVERSDGWTEWRLAAGCQAALPERGTGAMRQAALPEREAGAGRAAALPEPALSGRLRRRLRAAVVWHGFRRKAAARIRAAVQRPAWVAMAGTGLALVVFAGLLLANRIGGGAGSVSPQRYAELHEPEGAAVMSRPDTVVYKLDRAAQGVSADTKETVWINVRTHELFLLLEGILPSDSLDVQAWAEYDGGSANLGLLQFHQNQAHLYSRNVRPEQWKALMLTIEPKGGSALPTSPQTASIRLRPAE